MDKSEIKSKLQGAGTAMEQYKAAKQIITETGAYYKIEKIALDILSTVKRGADAYGDQARGMSDKQIDVVSACIERAIPSARR